MKQAYQGKKSSNWILDKLSPITTYRLETIAQLTFIFFIALIMGGILIQGFSLYPLVFSMLISSILGPIVGLMEIAVYPTLLHKHSFLLVLFSKTLVNLLIVLLTLLPLAYLLGPWLLLQVPGLGVFLQVKQGVGIHLLLNNWHVLARAVIIILNVCLGVTFVYQMIQKMGRKVFWRFVTGKYHQPREENRIFMFLDLKGSTSIAEKIGHELFSQLISDCYHDLTRPLLETEGEVYQYVGDQAVLTWLTVLGIQKANCVRCFYLFDEQIRKRERYYLQKYGIVPSFKAGMHCGKVMATQVGVLKSELVYHGDVVNTAARLEAECNRLVQKLLLSADLYQLLKPQNTYHYAFLQPIHLRGKKQELSVYTAQLN
jgi:adenylate cyclase